MNLLGDAFKNATSMTGERAVGGHYARIKEGRIVVTPALAQKILAECRYEGQRKLESRHVSVLASLMQRHRWTAGMQIHFGLLNGVWHLVDGQHRMHAVAHANVPVEFSFLVSECETAEELAQIYYRHDTVSKGRTFTDVLQATGAHEEFDISRSDGARVLSAIIIIGAGFKSKHLPELSSPDARLELARSWWPTAQQYLAMISPAEIHLKRRLLRQTTMAVGLMTIKYQPDTASEFWEGIAKDDGLRRGDPRKTLITYLNNYVAGGDNSNSYAVRAVAVAWNAWFEKRDLSILKPFVDSPVVIAGTPFTRRKAAA